MTEQEVVCPLRAGAAHHSEWHGARRKHLNNMIIEECGIVFFKFDDKFNKYFYPYMNDLISRLSMLYAFCNVSNKIPNKREVIMWNALLLIEDDQNMNGIRIRIRNWFHEVDNERVLDFHKALVCAWIAMPDPFITTIVPFYELFDGLDWCIVEMIMGEFHFQSR